jgi:Protein of unknown function (DUF3617)
MPARLRMIGLTAMTIALPALAADALQVKTGLWETTSTITLSGMRMPAEQLAKLPPAQRAQMEQMMKQMTGERPITDRSCVTQKDLQEGAFRKQAEQDAGRCSYTQVTGTARHQEWTFQCSNAEGEANGRMTMDAPDSTHVQGALEMKSTRGNTNIKFAARWISASCAGADKD